MHVVVCATMYSRRQADGTSRKTVFINTIFRNNSGNLIKNTDKRIKYIKYRNADGFDVYGRVTPVWRVVLDGAVYIGRRNY